MPKTTTRWRAPLTDDERAERRERDRKRMREAVERLRSSEGWTGWLRARRTLHAYSMSNLLLILQQKPDAAIVAGFKAWLELGYCVQKGARKLWLWHPVPPSKQALQAWREAGADPAEKPRPRFVMKPSVFDVSDVAPLPPPACPAPLQPPTNPILGEDRGHLLKPLRALIEHHGCALRVADGRLPNGAEGFFAPKANGGAGEIVLAGELSGNGRLAVGVHEAAHLLTRRYLQTEQDRPADEPRLTYAEEELIVESVAFTVCGAVGLDTEASSVPYVASWAEQAPLETLERCAHVVDELARVIEDALPAGEERWAPAPAPAAVAAA